MFTDFVALRYIPTPVVVEINGVWGVDNFKRAVTESARLHHQLNRMMWKSGLRTSKCAGLKYYI